eukprot:COSAG05_NODE_46_length_25233_cov_40.235741_20_plen_153_part_00
MGVYIKTTHPHVSPKIHCASIGERYRIIKITTPHSCSIELGHTHHLSIGVFQCRYRIGQGWRSRGGLSAVAQCRTRTPWPRWLNWLVYCTQQDMSWAGSGAFTTARVYIDSAVVWGYVRMPASHYDVVTLRTWMPPPSGHDRTGVATEIKAK